MTNSILRLLAVKCRTGLSRIARHPSITLASFVLAVARLAAILYFAIFPSLPKPPIEFYVQPVRAEIDKQGVGTVLTFSINEVPVTQKNCGSNHGVERP